MNATYHSISAFHTDNLFLHVFDVLEGLMGSYTVHDDKALTILYVQISHGGKLLRSGSIQYLQNAARSIYFNLFPVEIFYCWVISKFDFEFSKNK